MKNLNITPENKESIFNTILRNRPLYCHAIEVENLYEYKSAIEAIYNEFIETHTVEDIKDFFNSIQLYSLSDEEEVTDQIYDFITDDYIDSL